MPIAGHVSRKMFAHYSHVRLDATMGRGKEIGSERTSKGYDPNDDTKVSGDLSCMLQIADSLVELSGIEPPI
jgi:hypothetical protein